MCISGKFVFVNPESLATECLLLYLKPKDRGDSGMLLKVILHIFQVDNEIHFLLPFLLLLIRIMFSVLKRLIRSNVLIYNLPTIMKSHLIYIKLLIQPTKNYMSVKNINPDLITNFSFPPQKFFYKCL